MNTSLSQPSPRATVLRVFGATGALFVVLVAALLVTRPAMMMAAMHAAASLIFVP